MSPRQPLPASLHGTAFASGREGTADLSRARLRGKDVDRPFLGVRSIGLDLSDLEDRCRALSVVMTGGVFSHSTALALWNAPLPPWLERGDAPLHVSSSEGNRMRRPGVVGHRLSTRTDTRITPAGLTTITPAVAWCQLAEHGAQKRHPLTLEDIVAVGDFLVSGPRRTGGRRDEPLCTIEELRHAARAHGRRRGARLLDEALRLVRPDVDSRRETRLRLAFVFAGLPEPAIGCPVQTGIGVLHPDLAYPALRLAFEYEGDHHRTDAQQWRDDFVRVRALQGAGWTVIRVNKDDLDSPARSRALIRQVRSLLTPDAEWPPVARSGAETEPPAAARRAGAEAQTAWSAL